jgi:hypothetical protein
MRHDERRSGRASRGQDAPAVVGPYNGMGECCGDDGGNGGAETLPCKALERGAGWREVRAL